MFLPFGRAMVTLIHHFSGDTGPVHTRVEFFLQRTHSTGICRRWNENHVDRTLQRAHAWLDVKEKYY